MQKMVLALSPNRFFSRKQRSTKSNEKKVIIGDVPPVWAPWKIENLLSEGPPTDDDWWKHTSKIDDDDIVDTDNRIMEAPIKNKIIINADEKSDDNNNDDDDNDNDDDTVKIFRNVGLENWEKVREAWRFQTVETRRPPPPTIRYKDLKKRVSTIATTYELPRRVVLTDIVNVFVRIWERKKDN